MCKIPSNATTSWPVISKLADFPFSNPVPSRFLLQFCKSFKFLPTSWLEFRCRRNWSPDSPYSVSAHLQNCFFAFSYSIQEKSQPIQFLHICKTDFHIQWIQGRVTASTFCTVFTLVTTNDKIWKSKWMSPWKNERQDSQINGEDIFHWVLQISAFYFPTFEKADCSIFSLSVSGSVGWCHH